MAFQDVFFETHLSVLHRACKLQSAPSAACAACAACVNYRCIMRTLRHEEVDGLIDEFAALVLWEMAAHLPGLDLHHYASTWVVTWLEFALATPVALWAGWPFFVRAGASVRNRSLNMFTLIALGTGAAYIYSVVAMLAPRLFPPSLREMQGGVAPVYYEAAAVITVLVLLGQVLELRAREQTSGAIRALLNLAPKTAHRITDDGRDEGTSRPHRHAHG